MTTFAFIRSTLFPAAFGCALILSLPAQATDHSSHNMQHGDAMSSSAETMYHATGTLKRWGKTDVSITHDPIAALNWPVMTMSFSLPENGELQALPDGSKVTFSFRQTADGYELTQISPAAQ